MESRVGAAKYHRRALVTLAVALAAGLVVVGVAELAPDRNDPGAVASAAEGAPAQQAGGEQRSNEGAAGQEGIEEVKDPDAGRGGPIRLEISVSGDILIHSPIYRRALANGNGRYDFRPMFREIRSVIRRADLSICHLETPLTRGTPHGFPTFATPARLADAIAATGWDACTTASNHSLDRGLAGIRTTSNALNRVGVSHTGSARSARQSRRSILLRAGGARIGLLSYTTATNGIPLPKPWSVNLASSKRILADARRARRRGADAVIVNIHWGTEDSSTIDTRQRALAEKLTRSDAVTAVVGQGPHVVQRIRRVNGTSVVFSEGNLLSNQTPACCARGSQDGLVALLSVVIRPDRDRVRRVKYVPTWVRHPGYIVLPVGSAARRGLANRATLRASYRRTVAAAGRGDALKPIPRRAP